MRNCWWTRKQHPWKGRFMTLLGLLFQCTYSDLVCLVSFIMFSCTVDSRTNKSLFSFLFCSVLPLWVLPEQKFGVTPIFQQCGTYHFWVSSAFLHNNHIIEHLAFLENDTRASFAWNVLTFFILNSNLIPISLQVTLEIVLFFQVCFFGHFCVPCFLVAYSHTLMSGYVYQ